MASPQTVLVLTIIVFAHHVFALNILAIVSIPLRSHYMAFKPLFRELANRGHSVTVMNNFPDSEPMSNLKFVDLQAALPPGGILPLEYYENLDSSYMHLFNFYRHIKIAPSGTRADCEILFTNENAKRNLARGIKYDVIFVEQFLGDCGLAYAAAHYDAPIIGITSHVLLPWAYSRLGIPFVFAADAFYFSNSGPNPSFYQKIESAILHFYFNTINRWYIQSKIYDAFSRYLPNYELDLERVAKERMKMIFSYQHFSVTGAHLLAPQLLEIGGIHISTPKTVPTEIEKFLSIAEHGAIYVSFGSYLKANTMSKNKLQQFLDAFKRIPQKIIWKWENASLPAGNENVFTSSWLPQLDILCHPKVVAFVSHGGMLGMSEAAHCGKPVLAVPFFGDQFVNAAFVIASGLGKRLFFDHLNSESLVKEIKELTSQEMQLNAQRISKLWHDRPLPVMDSAIYWTEYVARHRSAPPSLPSKFNTWFQSSHLDVYSVLFIILLLVVLLLYVIFKLLVLLIIKSFQKLMYSYVRKSKRE